jgi:serine/threonine-protein kinase
LPRSDESSADGSAHRWQGKRLGKFRLLGLLGQGSMGKVFRAQDTTLQRQVALKVMVIPDGGDADSRRVRQFVREARAAARLNHPHIVNVLEIDQQQDMLYIAMDLVEGGDVKGLIQAGGALDPARACDLAADAAEALAFGHREGVIHRDVKPSNLMMTRAGRCKLADFGLAEFSDPHNGLRRGDGIVGTPRYMAPEVARGLPAVAASDQYSLGCTLWHMLTGRPIFEGAKAMEVVHQQAHEPTPDLARLRPDLPANLVAVVEQAVAKDPADRHADTDTLAKQLRSHAVALAPAGASASGSHGPAGLPTLGRKRAGRPWVGGAAAMVGLGLAAGAAVLWAPWDDRRSAPTAAAEREAPTGAADPRADATRFDAPLRDDAEPEAPDVFGPRPTVADEAKTGPEAATDRPGTGVPGAGNLGAGVPGAAVLGPGDPPNLTADQTDELKALADRRGLATVTGTVSRAYVTSSGKTFIVRFEGAPSRGFQVAWLPDHFETMAAAFGGEAGEGIVGQTIRVTGPVESFFGTPRIVVIDPQQITIR